jgi:NhaP-type Na+/H+ or K+/H+ antiporter
MLIPLCAIVVLGISAQLVAARLRVPSILILLLTGFVVGPVAGWIDPDRLLGDLLFPFVQVAVGIVLFEGCLTLGLVEIRRVGHVVAMLITLGALATWGVLTAAAVLLLGFDLRVALLLGAILVVTGPTVTTPLLQFVRPIGPAGPILKWEGLLIDPIGAALATIVADVAFASELYASSVLLVALRLLGIGAVFGVAGAFLVTFALRRFLVPDALQSPFVLAVVLAAFAGASALQPDSGLIAVTGMGFLLANTRGLPVDKILEFKENLAQLLIATLFILLAARVPGSLLRELPLGGTLAFLLAAILVARPLAVAAATLGSKLRWADRAFLTCLAPRGIVAASVASIFALRLEQAEVQAAGASLLVPVTFSVIVGTVLCYGLLAAPVARRLGLAIPDPQGLLLIGAQDWVRELALAVQQEGFQVVLVDSNRANVRAARMAGLTALFGNALSEQVDDELELGGLGRILALTPNDETNALACLHFAPVFGRRAVFQLLPESEEQSRRQALAPHLRGRYLFGPGMHGARIGQARVLGGRIKKTKLSEEFGYDSFQQYWGGRAIPMLVITAAGKLRPLAVDDAELPGKGELLISLVPDGAAPATN